MKINYHGHSCFTVVLENGASLLLDPYNGSVGYPLVERKADVVTCSHHHGDHHYLENIQPGYRLVEGTDLVTVKGFTIYGVPTSHDAKHGADRGDNIVYCVEAEGIRLAHLGDLGHVLTQEQMEAIGRCDVLMVPVGGYYTIDAAAAAEVTEAIKPLVAIPMHYRTACSADMPIATEEEYLSMMRENEYAISALSSTQLELDPEDMPRARRMVLMEYK